MRSCCAVYVDVGYLLAAAATRVTGSSLRRGVQTDYAALIEALEAQAEADSGLPLLRVNWYDAGGRPGGMPDLTQDEIGLLPRVKLRLGRLSYSGEQKGVDVRIGLDLAIQARQRVADVVYLVSGDDDLTEAVEEAQGQGVQVVLLAVPRHDGKPLAVAKHLAREVDRTLVIDPATIDAAVRPTALPEALVPDSLFDVEPADGSEGAGQDADGAQSSGGTADAATGATDTGADEPDRADSVRDDATGEADAHPDDADRATTTGAAPRRRRVTRILHREHHLDPEARDEDPIPPEPRPADPHRSPQRPDEDEASQTRLPHVPTPGPRPPHLHPTQPSPAGPTAEDARASGGEPPRLDTPRLDTPRLDTPRLDPSRLDPPTSDAPPSAPADRAGQTPHPAPHATPDDAPDDRPSPSPSPAVFARRKAGGLALPGAALPLEPPTPGPHEDLTVALADGVARQVVAAWCASATPDALVDLRRAAPMIPAELDRALLVDLSSSAEGIDLTDRDRQYVRARFWYHVGRVRPV